MVAVAEPVFWSTEQIVEGASQPSARAIGGTSGIGKQTVGVRSAGYWTHSF
jgi:hypothetical protein